VLTTHRRENLGHNMEAIFSAINQITSEFKNIKVIFPIHLNPQIRKLAEQSLSKNNQVKIIEPLSVVDFHNFLNKADLILTDSGGIQEEAPFLNKPVIVLRDTTERPEGIAAGTLILAGTSVQSIYEKTKLLLTDDVIYKKMANAKNPYGNGTTSEQIVDILKKQLK